MLRENGKRGAECAMWFHPPAVQEKMCSLMCLKDAGFHIFFINSFICYLSRFNNLKTKVTSSCTRGWQAHDSRFIIVCFSSPLSLCQPSSLLARFHPGRQVLGLWLAFCIVGSDGTADALYCEPDIAVPWLQSDGQLDTGCAPCPGIKRKTNQQTDFNTWNQPTSPQIWCKNITIIIIIIIIIITQDILIE